MALSLIEKQPWYQEHFVQYVFDLDDDLITGDDVRALRHICLQSDDRIPRIITRLVLRYDKDQFPKVNISLLFDILDAMPAERAADILDATFGESRYVPRSYYRYPVTMLVSHLRPILTRTGDEWQPSFAEFGRLLLYLWNVRDETYGYPVRQLFAEFQRAHPELATKLMSAHVSSKCKGYTATRENELLLAEWSTRPVASGDEPATGSGGSGDSKARVSSQRRAPITLRGTDIGVIISWSKRPTLEACLARAKVRPRSCAAEIVQRLYDSCVNDALDLKAQFGRYYRPEYTTIERFLYHKCGCGGEYVTALKTDLNSDRFVGLVQEHFGRDWSVGALVENIDEGDRALFKILGAEWVSMQ